MKKMNINVNYQKLFLPNKQFVVELSKNYLEVQFNFLDDNWNNCDLIIAILKNTNGEITKEVLDNNNSIIVKKQVLIGGYFEVSLCGYNHSLNQEIPTDVLTVPVNNSLKANESDVEETTYDKIDKSLVKARLDEFSRLVFTRNNGEEIIVLINDTTYFKGEFTSYEELVKKYPTGETGDYAYVNTTDNDGDLLIKYAWDADSNSWKEYSTDKYVTSAKFELFKTYVENKFKNIDKIVGKEFKPLQVGDKMPMVFTKDMLNDPTVISAQYGVGNPQDDVISGYFWFDPSSLGFGGWNGDVLGALGVYDEVTETLTIDLTQADISNYIIRTVDTNFGEGLVGIWAEKHLTIQEFYNDYQQHVKNSNDKFLEIENNVKELENDIEELSDYTKVAEVQKTLIEVGTVIPAGTKLTKENVSVLTTSSAVYSYKVVGRTDFRGSFGWLESQQKFSYYAPSYMNQGSQQQLLDEIVFEEDVEVYNIPLMSGPQNIYLITETRFTSQEVYDTFNENITNLNENKVDKVEGKGLSTNDYTDEDKAFLELIKNDSAYVGYGSADNMTINEAQDIKEALEGDY